MPFKGIGCIGFFVRRAFAGGLAIGSACRSKWVEITFCGGDGPPRRYGLGGWFKVALVGARIGALEEGITPFLDDIALRSERSHVEVS